MAPRISKWVTVAAPRVPLLILGKSRLCYHPRSSRGTSCPLHSGGEGDTALSDGSQCGIGIRASDRVVVITTAVQGQGRARGWACLRGAQFGVGVYTGVEAPRPSPQGLPDAHISMRRPSPQTT